MNAAYRAYEAEVYSFAWKELGSYERRRSGEWFKSCRRCGQGTWAWDWRNLKHKPSCDRLSYADWFRFSPNAEPYRDQAVRDVRAPILAGDLDQDGHSDFGPEDELEVMAEEYRGY